MPVMLTVNQLLFLNALCMFVAVLFSVTGEAVRKALKLHHGIKRRELMPYSRTFDYAFIVWTCLYITIQLCVFHELVLQTQISNIKYLCSWFSTAQVMFYSSFLLSHVTCYDEFTRKICELGFPLINAISWIVCTVCMTNGQGYAEFQDLRSFTVHILPTIAASFHEIYIYNFSGFVPSCHMRTSHFKSAWAIYSPALFLSFYALSHDENEVYIYVIRPPSPLFVIIIGMISNIRYVFFPLQY